MINTIYLHMLYLLITPIQSETNEPLVCLKNELIFYEMLHFLIETMTKVPREREK